MGAECSFARCDNEQNQIHPSPSPNHVVVGTSSHAQSANMDSRTETASGNRNSTSTNSTDGVHVGMSMNPKAPLYVKYKIDPNQCLIIREFWKLIQDEKALISHHHHTPPNSTGYGSNGPPKARMSLTGKERENEAAAGTRTRVGIKNFTSSESVSTRSYTPEPGEMVGTPHRVLAVKASNDSFAFTAMQRITTIRVTQPETEIETSNNNNNNNNGGAATNSGDSDATVTDGDEADGAHIAMTHLSLDTVSTTASTASSAREGENSKHDEGEMECEVKISTDFNGVKLTVHPFRRRKSVEIASEELQRAKQKMPVKRPSSLLVKPNAAAQIEGEVLTPISGNYTIHKTDRTREAVSPHINPEPVTPSAPAAVTSRLVAFYNCFYQQLFVLCPAVKPMFKNNMRVQGRALSGMISTVISVFVNGDLKAAQGTIGVLAKSHRARGINRPHYDIVGDLLSKAMKETLPNEFGEAEENAWKHLYAAIMKILEEHDTTLKTKKK